MCLPELDDAPQRTWAGTGTRPYLVSEADHARPNSVRFFPGGVSTLVKGKQMRTMGVALAVLGVAVGLAGCGAGGNYSSPKATYETMWSAAKAGNKDAMMACFSDACAKKMAALEKLFADLPTEMKQAKQNVTDELMTKAKTAKVEVGPEKVDGDKATLEVTTDGRKDTLHFIREGGAWKLHFQELADLDIEQMKKMIDLFKNIPKGMMDGLQKGMRKGVK